MQPSHLVLFTLIAAGFACSPERDFGDPEPSTGGASGSVGTSGSGGKSGSGAAPGAGGASGAAGASGADTSGAGMSGAAGDGMSGAAGACGAGECECETGELRSCSDGGFLGSCASGVQICEAGGWGQCSIVPADADSCVPGNDDSCNGVANEGCACGGGDQRPCSEGGALGTCATGTQTCDDQGSWGPCSVTPAASDTCAPGNDDNCNGVLNEGCACREGDERSCADGGLVGKCTAGVQVCTAAGAWGACSITPSAADTCVLGNNDNCTGPANEGCLCIESVTTRDCGPCSDGSQTCINGKTNQFSTCTGATPANVYFRDGDDDGFGAESLTVCGAAPPGYVSQPGDCYDQNKDAFPGQTRWFYVQRGDGSYDYNCDNRVEYNIDVGFDQGPSGCGGTCPGTCGPTGRLILMTRPECGGAISSTSCTCAGPSCQLVGSSFPQTCR